MNAVITADVVNYSKLSHEVEELVIKAIYSTFDTTIDLRTNVKEGNFVISRGDNIQIELEKPSDALRAALLLKSSINKIVINKGYKTKPAVDVRIAIGVGEISGKRKYVNESTGFAYTFSGRTLDSMKKNKRTLAIKTFNDEFNEELETEFKLLEVIMTGWTVNSAEVIYWLLSGLNETDISLKLGITQPAINQRKKTAGWSGIEPLLQRFVFLMEREAAK